MKKGSNPDPPNLLCKPKAPPKHPYSSKQLHDIEVGLNNKCTVVLTNSAATLLERRNPMLHASNYDKNTGEFSAPMRVVFAIFADMFVAHDDYLFKDNKVIIHIPEEVS